MDVSAAKRVPVERRRVLAACAEKVLTYAIVADKLLTKRRLLTKPVLRFILVPLMVLNSSVFVWSSCALTVLAFTNAMLETVKLLTNAKFAIKLLVKVLWKIELCALTVPVTSRSKRGALQFMPTRLFMASR
jgi:hypothetical protein